MASANFCFPENCKVVNGFTALGIGTAGAVYGAYISVKNLQRVWVVVNYRQGDATQVTWSVQRASAIAGTDVLKVVQLMPIWTNEDCATSDLLVRRTDAVDQQLTVTQATKLIIMEVDPDAFGSATNGNVFDCMRGYPSSANIPVTSAWAMTYVCQPRYQSRVLTQPTIVLD